MFIIFGSRGITSASSQDSILTGSCPNCKNDLVLSDLKRWFTLFFIPVFPFETIDTFYKCNGCEGTYKEEIKQALQRTSREKEEMIKGLEKMYAITLTACVLHMAKVDGTISAGEEVLIKKIISNFPQYEYEINKLSTEIRNSSDADDLVFPLLQKSASILTSEAIMHIIVQVTKMLLADGKIGRSEEKLLKEYLLICGLPKNLFESIMEMARKNTSFHEQPSVN